MKTLPLDQGDIAPKNCKTLQIRQVGGSLPAKNSVKEAHKFLNSDAVAALLFHPRLPELSTNHSREVCSIAVLEEANRASVSGWEEYNRTVAELACSSTPVLIARIESTIDPLVHWEIHKILDKREVAPIFRWPRNDSTPQARFVTWLADVRWVANRKSALELNFSWWQLLCKQESDAWHASAVNVFRFVSNRAKGRCYYTSPVGLTDRDRSKLMTMKSPKQVRQLSVLDAASSNTLDAIITYASVFRDPTRVNSTVEIAHRRYEVWKTYILSNRSPTVAARSFHVIYGKAVTRQRISRQTVSANKAIALFTMGMRCVNDPALRH